MSDASPLVMLAREKYAERFRQAAGRLRQDLDDMERYKLHDECGRLIIEADDLGYLPVIPELRVLIDWHTGDGSMDLKPGMFFVKRRCPANLFGDVTGGHSIRVRQVNGKWTPVENPPVGIMRCGGLLPDSQPAILRLPDRERDAVACEYLAELIDSNAGKSTIDPHPIDDPLKTTLDLLSRSSKGPHVIRFLAAQPKRKASLVDVCKHAYGNRDKKSLEKCSLLIHRNALRLDDENAPLRIVRDKKTNVVSLIEG